MVEREGICKMRHGIEEDQKLLIFYAEPGGGGGGVLLVRETPDKSRKGKAPGSL